MTENRKKLSLRLPSDTSDEEAGDAVDLVKQALHHQLCLRWSYNRSLMRAEPQILYRKNGVLYLDAVVVERDGEPPVEMKLGSFRLAGLKNPVMTMEGFAPAEGIDLSDPRYQEGILARA